MVGCYTYIRPKERIPININFCLLWICKSYTIHVGRMSTSPSVMMEMAAVPVTKLAKSRHFAVALVVASHAAEIGKHWNIVSKKTVIIMRVFMINSVQIHIVTARFCPVRRNKKRRMDVLISAKMGLYRISVWRLQNLIIYHCNSEETTNRIEIFACSD